VSDSRGAIRFVAPPVTQADHRARGVSRVSKPHGRTLSWNLQFRPGQSLCSEELPTRCQCPEGYSLTICPDRRNRRCAGGLVDDGSPARFTPARRSVEPAVESPFAGRVMLSEDLPSSHPSRMTLTTRPLRKRLLGTAPNLLMSQALLHVVALDKALQPAIDRKSSRQYRTLHVPPVYLRLVPVLVRRGIVWPGVRRSAPVPDCAVVVNARTRAPACVVLSRIRDHSHPPARVAHEHSPVPAVDCVCSIDLLRISVAAIAWGTGPCVTRHHRSCHGK